MGEIAEPNSLRDWARRTVFAWGLVLGVAGFTLTFFASDSEDPCCHVQAPGFLLAGFGLVPMTTIYVRRKKFHELLAKSSSHHAFGEAEDELDRLSRFLTARERKQFTDARAGFTGRSRRRQHG